MGIRLISWCLWLTVSLKPSCPSSVSHGFSCKRDGGIDGFIFFWYQGLSQRCWAYPSSHGQRNTWLLHLCFLAMVLGDKSIFYWIFHFHIVSCGCIGNNKVCVLAALVIHQDKPFRESPVQGKLQKFEVRHSRILYPPIWHHFDHIVVGSIDSIK